MLRPKTLDRHIGSLQNHHIGRSGTRPITHKGAEKCHDHSIEERKYEKFVDEGEEEHGMWEDGWDTGFGETQPIFEDVCYAFYTEPAAEEDYCEGDVELGAVLEGQDAERSGTLPAGFRVHDGDLHESIQIRKLEDGNQEIIQYQPKLILLLLLLLLPLLIFMLHNSYTLYSKIFPRFDILSLDNNLFFLDFFATIFTGLIFLVDCQFA